MPMESASEAFQYTIPGHPPPPNFHRGRGSRSWGKPGDAEGERKAGIIMRATVHYLAPGTYFEQQTPGIRLRIKGR